MSTMDQSIRKYAEESTKSVIRPELGLIFDSLSEAYDFYNLYPWEIGFGIRYGKSRLNAQRTKCMQEIVCRCSGGGVRRTNLAIEYHASKIYTRAMFEEFSRLLIEAHHTMSQKRRR